MSKPIPLEEPIKRGEDEITAVEIRKPNSGALRGVSLRELLDLDVNALIKVLPRISTPSLTEVEVAGMDPADLTTLGSEVVSFLLPARAKAEAGI